MQIVLSAINRMYLWYWKILCSLRLTAIILILISISCFFGMFIDQTLGFDRYNYILRNDFQKRLFFVIFELDDLFHSFWFSILILVLALNLMACSCERLPRLLFNLKNVSFFLDKKIEKKLDFRRDFIVEDIHGAFSVINRFFGNGHRDHEVSMETGYFFFKEKYKFSRFGVFIVHLSLLFILFGSAATNLFGLEGILVLKEGELENNIKVKDLNGSYFGSHNMGFFVKCDAFNIKTFSNGAPMSFESELSIYSGSKFITSKTVKVNSPLSHNGYTFYQSFYEPPLENETFVTLLIAEKQGFVLKKKVRLGETIMMPDETLFTPLLIDSSRNQSNRAVKIEKKSKNGAILNFYVFSKHKRSDFFIDDKWNCVIEDIDAGFFTGLSVRKSSFESVVFFGCGLLFVGVILSFLFNHTLYYARIDKKSEREYRVCLGLILKKKALFLKREADGFF